MKRIVLILLALSTGVFAGCDSGSDSPLPAATAVSDASSPAVYEVRGRVVDLLSDGRTMVVDHETIPGYMAAMTMPFVSLDSAELSDVRIGDAVSFQYHVSHEGMWISDVERLEPDAIAVSPTEEAEPEYEDPTAESLFWLDGTWTDQKGNQVRLSDFEGRPVVMSMIFTNCGYACPMIVRDMKRIGDAVSFQYHVSHEGMWISDVERLEPDAIAVSPTEEAEPEYEDPTAESLFWLDGTWTDQKGNQVRLSDFEGRPVVMSMIFTNCGYACPMIVRDMKRIGAQLPEHQVQDVQYLLVTLDPDRDTPEMMQKFATAHRLDDCQWTLLRGSKSQVRMLAVALGISYRQESDGQFAHSNLVTILDTAGEIAHQQRGLEQDGQSSAKVISDLLAAQSK